MTDLEFRYRLLMRAYPKNHRADHEEEIIATLLDVAENGQTRPRLREAAALLTAGVACRVQQSAELKPGLRIAGLIALAGMVGISTMAIVVAAHRPLDLGLMPVIAWLTVIATGLAAAWSTSTYRIMPSATVALAMTAAGSSVMGLRRSTIVPAAILLIVSAYSQSGRRPLRQAAVTVGAALGGLQGWLLAANIDRTLEAADSPWVYAAQWDIASDVLLVESPIALLLYLLAAVVVGFWRMRFGIAAAVLAIPLAAVTLFGPAGPMLYIVGPRNSVVLGVTTGAITLALLALTLWNLQGTTKTRSSG